MPKFVKYETNAKGEKTKRVALAMETSNPTEAVTLRAQGFHELKPGKAKTDDGDDDKSNEAKDPDDTSESSATSTSTSGGSRSRSHR